MTIVPPWPPRMICGRKVLSVMKWEVKFVVIERSMSEISSSRRGLPLTIAALLIRTVGVPSWMDCQ